MPEPRMACGQALLRMRTIIVHCYKFLFRCYSLEKYKYINRFFIPIDLTNICGGTLVLFRESICLPLEKINNSFEISSSNIFHAENFSLMKDAEVNWDPENVKT